jgi:limonene-1,2-epoxide hydrolase
MAATGTQNGSATHATTRIVVDFLEALADGDVDRAMGMLTEDAVWINVSLPAVRGRRRIERMMRVGYDQLGARFRVHFHHVSGDGSVVLTERTDAIGIGRVEQRFWVYGRFATGASLSGATRSTGSTSR